MKTRITELFGHQVSHSFIRHELDQRAENGCRRFQCRQLVILATGPLNAEQTRQAIKEIRSLTDKPFGANATLLFPGASQNAGVLLQNKCPSLIFRWAKAIGW